MLIVVHACSKVFVEVDDIVANLTHLVDGVVHVVDSVGVQGLGLELAASSGRRDLVFHDQIESLTLL